MKSPTVLLETAFSLYFLAAVALAAGLGMWLAIPFLALFLHGYGWVSVLSWRERHERTAAFSRASGSAG